MLSVATSLVAASLLGSATAFPALATRDEANATDLHFYQPPGPGDARAPCPGMNTLANHGYLPRNGREIVDDVVVDAFMQGFNMDESVVHKALLNMFSVCRYVMGKECVRDDGKRVMPNLTILAEPHTFEHDHSFSRQDYRMAWANGATVDNFNYNATVFGRVLDIINGSEHIDYQLANQVRLDRYSQSLVDDLPGWFTAANPQAGTEMGFIFSVMRDRALPDNEETPRARTDWVHYWLANESFPYPLGWTKPEKVVNKEYVDSISAEIYSATVTATPSPVADNWIHNTDGTFLLPTTATVPILALPTDQPYYVAPDAQALQTVAPSKRDSQQKGAYGVPMATHIAAAVSAAQEQPQMLNPYNDEISHEHFSRMHAYGVAKVSAYKAKMLKAAA